jgi:hypothetical protein
MSPEIPKTNNPENETTSELSPYQSVAEALKDREIKYWGGEKATATGEIRDDRLVATNSSGEEVLVDITPVHVRQAQDMRQGAERPAPKPSRERQPKPPKRRFQNKDEVKLSDGRKGEIQAIVDGRADVVVPSVDPSQKSKVTLRVPLAELRFAKDSSDATQATRAESVVEYRGRKAKIQDIHADGRADVIVPRADQKGEITLRVPLEELIIKDSSDAVAAPTESLAIESEPSHVRTTTIEVEPPTSESDIEPPSAAIKIVNTDEDEPEPSPFEDDLTGSPFENELSGWSLLDDDESDGYGASYDKDVTADQPDGLDDWAARAHENNIAFEAPDGTVLWPTGDIFDGKVVVQARRPNGELDRITRVAKEDLLSYAFYQGDPADGSDTHPERNVSSDARNSVRDTIKEYNDRSSYNAEILDLNDLEKKMLEDPAGSEALIAEALDELRQNSPDDFDKIAAYLRDLRDVAGEKRATGRDNPEIRERLEDDLEATRTRLALLTRKRINSPAVFNWMRRPKNRKELDEAQGEYDEALRSLGQWQLLGLEGARYQESAADLLLSEMVKLRSSTREIREALGPKNKVQEFLDKKFTLGKKLWGRNKGDKIEANAGKVLLTGAMIAGGAIARAAAAPTGYWGTIAVAAGIGAVSGGVAGAIRAQKDIQIGLDNRSSREEMDSDREKILKKLKRNDASIDEVLRGRLRSETRRALLERGGKVTGRTLRAMGRGATTAALSATIGYGAASAIMDPVGTAENLFSPPEVPNSGSEGFSGSDSVIAAGPENLVDKPAEIIPPSADELLQHYAGENADSAAVVEAGQGPYALFENMGIPPEEHAGLFNDTALMEELEKNGDGYSLKSAGIQENGFGLSHEGAISPESVQAIYEAADMTSPDALAMADMGLPPTYADLPADLQTIAVENPVLTDIPNGMGGQELMNQLGIEREAWGAIQQDLLEAAPKDFYDMGNGNVGISHTGPLSADGVRTLVDQLGQHNYRIR